MKIFMFAIMIVGTCIWIWAAAKFLDMINEAISSINEDLESELKRLKKG